MDRESKRRSSRSRSPTKRGSTEKRPSKLSNQDKRGSKSSKVSGGGSRRGSRNSRSSVSEKKPGTEVKNETDTQRGEGEGAPKQSIPLGESAATMSSAVSDNAKQSLPEIDRGTSEQSQPSGLSAISGGSKVSKQTNVAGSESKVSKQMNAESSGSKVGSMSLDQVAQSINPETAGKDMPVAPGPCNAATNTSDSGKCDAGLCVKLREEFTKRQNMEEENEMNNDVVCQPKRTQSIQISESQIQNENDTGSKPKESRLSQKRTPSQMNQSLSRQSEQRGSGSMRKSKGSVIHGSKSLGAKNKKSVSRESSRQGLQSQGSVDRGVSGELTSTLGSQMEVPGGLEGDSQVAPNDPDSDIPPDFYYGYYRPSPCSNGNFCTDGRTAVTPLWNEPNFPVVTHPHSSCGPPRRIIIPFAYEMLPMPLPSLPSQDEGTQTEGGEQVAICRIQPQTCNQKPPNGKTPAQMPPAQTPPQNGNPSSRKQSMRRSTEQSFQGSTATGMSAQGQSFQGPTGTGMPAQGQSFQGPTGTGMPAQGQSFQGPTGTGMPAQGQYTTNRQSCQYPPGQRSVSQGLYPSGQRPSQVQFSSSQQPSMRPQSPSQSLPPQGQICPGQCQPLQGQYPSVQRQPPGAGQGQLPAGQYPSPQRQGQYRPNQVQNSTEQGGYPSDYRQENISKTNIPYQCQTTCEKCLPPQEMNSQNRSLSGDKQFPSVSRSQPQNLSLGQPSQEDYVIDNIQHRPDDQSNVLNQSCQNKGQMCQNQRYSQQNEEVKYSSNERNPCQKRPSSPCPRLPQEGNHTSDMGEVPQQSRPPSSQGQKRFQVQIIPQQGRVFIPGQSSEIELCPTQSDPPPRKDMFSARNNKALPNCRLPQDPTQLYIATSDYGKRDKGSYSTRNVLWDPDVSTEEVNDVKISESTATDSEMEPEPSALPPLKCLYPTPSVGQIRSPQAVASTQATGVSLHSEKSLQVVCGRRASEEEKKEEEEGVVVCGASYPPCPQEDQGTQTYLRSRSRSPLRPASPKWRSQELNTIEERPKDAYPIPPHSTLLAFSSYFGQEESQRRAGLRPPCGHGINMPPCPSGSWRGDSCLQGLETLNIDKYDIKECPAIFSKSRASVTASSASFVAHEDMPEEPVLGEPSVPVPLPLPEEPSDSAPNLNSEQTERPPVIPEVPVYTYRDPMCNPLCRPPIFQYAPVGANMSLKLVNETFTGLGPTKLKCPNAPFQFQGEASRNDRRFVLPEAQMKLSLDGLNNPWFSRSLQGMSQRLPPYVDERRCTTQNISPKIPRAPTVQYLSELSAFECQTNRAVPEKLPVFQCQTNRGVPETLPALECDGRPVGRFQSLRSVTCQTNRQVSKPSQEVSLLEAYSSDMMPDVRQRWSEDDVVRERPSQY